MDKYDLLQLFNEQTSGKNEAKGLRVFNNDLVSSIKVENKDDIIDVNGNVISESLFNEYLTKIKIDAVNKTIISTYCSCKDYENHENKKNYCCKHLIASFYKAEDEILKDPAFKSDKVLEAPKVLKVRDTLGTLLDNETEKEKIKLEVYVNRNVWTHKISAQFKIGDSSMSSSSLYVLRDMNEFIASFYNKRKIDFGKRFVFDTEKYSMASKDKKLFRFLKTLQNIDLETNFKRNKNSVIEGKYINIPDYFVREFFSIIKNHRVYLNEGFLSRPYETEIIFDRIPLEFDLKNVKEKYILKIKEGMPKILTEDEDAFEYAANIYIPDLEYCDRLKPYLEVFNKNKVVTFPKSKEEVILKKLIPNLEKVSMETYLSDNIKNKIVRAKCNFKFYFDKKDEEVILYLKVEYAGFEFNIFEDCSEKVIYRNTKRENQVIGIVRSLGFEKTKNKFCIMLSSDDYIFRFFKVEVKRLEEIGEVFYSENFKGIKNIGSSSIKADIKTGKYSYFEMNFNIADIPKQEMTSILRAFRDKLKYYKLKDGQFIDLESLQIKNFLKLLDVVAPSSIDENQIIIPKNKAVYVEEYIEKNDLRYIKGEGKLKSISEKLKKISNTEFKLPEKLKAKLRGYQETGYNWFRTLDYLGFGGILADEMGLGKTLQTIAFLLSRDKSKSLIVVPTSLIYNWKNEFKKFAPSLNVAASVGNKKERLEILSNINKMDVVVTTYNILKRDIEELKGVTFDYCIIDEAQNIKNAHSENAKCIKKIEAKNRFALSGTPVENSVMELWSIFDFVMPGYLYDEKMFSVKYYKKIKEEPEVIEDLNRLIKPFILRRTKKEVIKELPDKIENMVMVSLSDKEKKIYSTFAKYALKLIKKKVEDDEFKSSKIEILAYITKLRQVCLDPSIVMEDYSGVKSKIDKLIEILKENIEDGHRILVFSQFTSVLKNIGVRMAKEKISYSYLDGSVPSKSRMKIVEEFNSGKNCAFLISLKAGGTGLNLTSADIVIHFDPWWNPAVEEQATDRTHRIGQKKKVHVIKLIAEGTIEEKIIDLQENKKKLAESLLTDGISSSNGLKSMSYAELVKLFK
ncbi:MAG: SNF2 helicase associated domain-containing protein [Clostridium sp.]|nr:SNF2 helicase associated domain-containing protein [Clostridium sp.]